MGIVRRKEMKDIAIFGAGGFGKEVACLINRINNEVPTWNFIGFFDDGVNKGTWISHYGEVLGGRKELNAWATTIDIVMAIGNPQSIKNVRERIDNPNVSFPNVIHPDIIIEDPDTCRFGEGNIFQGGCSLSCDVTIGNYNVFNGSVSMGHDDCIGNYNVIMPAVRISGEVEMGDCNLIGVGSIILQQLKIGDYVRLGAGAVLFTKPKDNNTYIGNPAKVFKF